MNPNVDEKMEIKKGPANSNKRDFSTIKPEALPFTLLGKDVFLFNE